MARENKPHFLKKDWHKLIRLGSTVKSKRKWRAAKGRQNKTRLERRSRQARPKVGWGNKIELKGKIAGNDFCYVLNLKDLESVNKGECIIIKKVGEKKRKEIIAKANEKGLKILNKYRGKNAAS